ncbi:MAG: hypothetical protein IPK66_04560 [Rhodospirillales bacterium]|nr:hypothetical protein [Rhodospirillales bacterium]
MAKVATAQIQRFLFERRFDLPAPQEAPAEPEPEAPPVFSAEDVERARAEGHAVGREQANAEWASKEHHEATLRASLDGIGERLQALQAVVGEARAQAERDAVLIAGVIAKRLLPVRYRENAIPEIEHLVATVLPRLAEETSINIAVAASLFPELGPRLEALALGNDLDGRLRITADAALPAGDCRMEWRGGGIVRDHAALWREVDVLVGEITGAAGTTSQARRLEAPTDGGRLNPSDTLRSGDDHG